MAYGTHVDNPMMGMMRTDVSFTLFLSDPESYEGGELIIETVSGEQPIKLPAGSMVAYPSTSLHRVAEVTKGERYAAVGWIRSFIRDSAKRELMFDLDTVRKSLQNKSEMEAERTVLNKTVANLFRMWSDD
jgi:PKHD-type hydroxylase